MADLESSVLQALSTHETIADSGEFASSLNVDHMTLVGVIRSLQASEMIVAEVGSAAAAEAQSFCCCALGRTKQRCKDR